MPEPAVADEGGATANQWEPPGTTPLPTVVIGAGQGGLSASYHLRRMGIDHVVLDGNDRPGGAWQHRWDDLTMADVHGIADLPDAERPPAPPQARANQAIPQYFAAYEQDHHLPVCRPVAVRRVEYGTEGFIVHANSVDREGSSRSARWESRTLINATGTWTRPFIPSYPGQRSFAGRQLHTAHFPGAEWFRGRRTVVVGGGASAVQFLGMLAPVLGAERLVWVTRTPPDWRTDRLSPELGRQAVAQVSERVRHGMPPRSVVSVTGLYLREQERRAAELGVYRARRPMFNRIQPAGVHWDDPSPGAPAFEPADVILWATGFRPAVDHLAPLTLTSPHGGIQLERDDTTLTADARIQLVGYGPSASTIGGNRAGQSAARGIRRALRAGAVPPR